MFNYVYYYMFIIDSDSPKIDVLSLRHMFLSMYTTWNNGWNSTTKYVAGTK